MSHQLPQALLLDLDDTILNDSGDVSQCWREACFAHQSELGAASPAALYETIERTRGWYWGDSERHRVGRLDLDAARREIVRMALAEIGVDSPPLAERIAARYGAQRDLAIQPIPGAMDTIRWLRDNRCRLALLTNGSGGVQRRKITRFGLVQVFDLILIEGELGFGKPDPRVYRLALDELGVGPTGAWMVGDNLEWDVAAPQRLGIHGIWVDVRGTGVPSGNGVRPDRIVRRLSELKEAKAQASQGT